MTFFLSQLKGDSIIKTSNKKNNHFHAHIPKQDVKSKKKTI